MIRAAKDGAPRWPLLVWHVIAAAALVAVPVRVLLGVPVPGLGADQAPAVLGPAAAYLLAGGFLVLGGRNGEGTFRSLLVLAAVLLPFCVGLLLLEGVWYSRWLLLVGLAASVLFIIAPAILAPRTLLRTAAGLAVLVLLAFVGRPGEPPGPDGGPTMTRGVLLTSHGSVAYELYSGYLAPRSRGGGIAILGDGYLLVTGDGDLFRIEWTQARDELQVTELPLRVPMNRDEFAAAVPDEVPSDWFRVADVLVRAAGDSVQILASHHYWHVDGDCFVARLSSVDVALADLDRTEGAPQWRTLYDTHPCLPIRHGLPGLLFGGPHIGGRLADFGSGRVLMTVGDHLFDGWHADDALPQDATADYGKVLLVHPDGTAERITMGHRNPQGLHIDSAGRIWLTEHGPEGGDALQEIIPGSNYGWPYFTLGTAYGDVEWPLEGPTDWDDSHFRMPVFAWVPSIGISNLIEVRRGPVSAWQGDLLVSSLVGNTLFRVRREEGRVVYVEPIPIGRRIRDLVEGEDGRIVLWADEGHIIRMHADVASGGQALFAQCVGCHATGAGEPTGLGPNLYGVYGRRIGGDPDFHYSPALRALGGHRWVGSELDAFLADPQGYAPGTTMVADPIPDPDEREALIEFLRTLR